jgi:hypothetical protein
MDFIVHYSTGDNTTSMSAQSMVTAASGKLADITANTRKPSSIHDRIHSLKPHAYAG